jgi:hypothetical protein
MASASSTSMGRCTRRLARQQAPNVEHALRVDSRPPVLLLRSFADDGVMRGDERFEVWLANELKKFGPLVAIGAPDNELPELGAYRSYVPNHEWQDYARSLMEKAQTILLIPSRRSPSSGKFGLRRPIVLPDLFSAVNRDLIGAMADIIRSNHR